MYTLCAVTCTLLSSNGMRTVIIFLLLQFSVFVIIITIKQVIILHTLRCQEKIHDIKSQAKMIFAESIKVLNVSFV